VTPIGTEPNPQDDEERASDPEFLSERPTFAEPVELPSFARPSSAPKNRALLTVLTGPEKGAIHRLPSGAEAVTLGRSEEATIRIPDQGLSRVHARLERIDHEFLLTDAGSTNGTFVDEVPVRTPVRIGAGARIRLGTRTLVSITMHDALEEEAALAVHEAALRDRLTGVYNRGVFDDRLAAEVAFAKRHGAPLSVLLFDIDFFKSFNDRHGHQAGDAVLVAVGRQVQKTVRTEDVLARYGGEEFAVIARGTPAEKAYILGERIRAAVALALVETAQGPLFVTASVGVASLGSEGDEPSDGASLVAVADKALYAAKARGRNCVVHGSELR
jgi:diguanylate cyclase (GGDEF)-like protein